MDTTALAGPSRALRWSVAVAFLGGCAALAALLAQRSVPPPTALPTPQTVLVQSVCLALIALSSYAGFLHARSGALTFGAMTAVGLLWAWAARQASWLEPAAFGVVMGATVWQRTRRGRRLLRLQQVVEDLREERTVKEQAMTASGQTQGALQKKLARYTQLQTIAEELSNMTDLGAIARLAVDRAFSLIGKSDVCLLFLVDPERQELSLFASKRREPLPPIRAKRGDQFDRYVLRSHSPLLVNDVRRDFRFTVTPSPERPVSSVIACPLLLGQSPSGVLRLDSVQPGAYTQDDLRLLDILLDLVATAVANARLFARTQQLAMTDGLTGLMLRRPFLERLTRELTRAGRRREPVSVVMLDVDHFKQYNDTFGHTAGDLVLKGVADVLRNAVPPGGIAARYGGEEFILLLPRLSRPQAADAAEKVRLMVEQRSLRGRRWEPSASTAQAGGPPATQAGARSAAGGEAPGEVTVSLGVAAFPDDAQAGSELIRIADARLYQAKRDGRNRVISSEQVHSP